MSIQDNDPVKLRDLAADLRQSGKNFEGQMADLDRELKKVLAACDDQKLTEFGIAHKRTTVQLRDFREFLGTMSDKLDIKANFIERSQQ
jgi:uncharacterized protein YukE